ncbi:GntR family transcriptional regulator [Marinomonas pollencensis]|uniref:GntR family transcriptional regulator n=1 Tax=Marinomonas pollencensis TaxID=491954 RepID=A0A3E0DUZ2_9GAMM|nr:GntR family transcriptional regulator [Marinomonas pollencensis]REG85479.1 GntR family transcriptional regulator [Marinomonas pollencensis]
MQLYQKIKDDILNNRLPVGRPLRQVELSERYQVSRIPVRDALQKLKAEGWLVSHGKAGHIIPDLNWQEAEDLCLMRADLEPRLLSYAFDSITAEDVKQARAALALLDKSGLSLLEKGELNWAFHKVLYFPANRPTLYKVVRSLNQQASRYLGFQYGPMNYQDHSQQEHFELLNLIESGEKSTALLLLSQHIKDAGQLLVAHLKSTN